MNFRILIFLVLILIPVSTPAADPTAYVLNTLGESISKINLKTGAIANDIIIVGSGILCYPNQMIIRDSLALIIASGTNEIQVINLNTESTAYFISTGSVSNPYWMEIIDDQYLYVSLMYRNSIALIDYVNRVMITEIDIGKSPEGLLLLKDNLYIACTGFDWGTYEYVPGQVYVYNVLLEEITDSIAVDLNPQHMAYDTLGRIHVVCTGDYVSEFGKINIIDTYAGEVVETLDLGGTPGHISIGPDNIAWIASAGWDEDGYVYTYHAITGEIFHDNTSPLEVDINCMAVAAYQDSTCFTASLTDFVNVIDSSGVNLGRYAVGDGPIHIAFNYIPGDANGDFSVNLLDATHLINWLYKGGPMTAWPYWRANVNDDATCNLLDVTYILNYLYKGGPRPRVSPSWIK